MKNCFKSEIQGRGFFKRYIIFLIPILILAGISQRTNESMTFVSTLASLIQSYLSVLLGFAFFSYLVAFVSFNDKGFSFTGSLKEIAPRFLKWYMLTIITLGIYSPWYIRNLIDYILSNTSYDGMNADFLSKPGKLLKYMLLTLYLPLLVLTAMFGIVIYRNIYADVYSWAAVAVPSFFFILIMFLVMIPFIYFYLAWLINLQFGGYKISLKLDMRETAVFLIPQLLLCIVTLFIYYPAALVRIYRFLLDGSIGADENGTEKAYFGFEGSAGKGFGLIWGQGLLSFITIGIYGPWAMSRVTNWFLNNTAVEVISE